MNALERSLDAVALIAGVVRAASALAIAPVVAPRASPTIPGTLTDVTAPWVEEVLQRDLPGARLAGIGQRDGSAGTTDRARLDVTYAASSARQHPPSLFVKLAPAGLPTRVFGTLMQLGATEVRFYQTVAPASPVMIPHSYGAALDARTQRFALVLEDLAARDAIFTDVSQPITVDLAARVVEALARLHAAYWASPRFDTELAWLRTPRRNPTIRLERALCAAAIGPGLRRFPGLISDAVRRAAPRIVGARDRLDAHWAGRPLTLIHGDCHSGNLYFLRDRVGFLDWQVTQCGPGLRDVSYFLISSLPTELRVAHQRELIAHYLASLAGGGVDVARFDDAWHEHRLHALHAWIAAIVTAAAATLQIEPIARAAVARSSQALVDLDALGALEALAG